MGLDPQSALVATALSQAPGIQNILAELQAVETQIATEQVRFHDQHPTVIDLQTQQANLQQVLLQRIEAVLGQGTLPENLNLEMGEVEAALVTDYLKLDAHMAGLMEQAEVLGEAESLGSAASRGFTPAGTGATRAGTAAGCGYRYL